MHHIVHDASVALWALRTNHCDRKDFRLGVSWPVSIRRAKPTYNGEWIVKFRRPQIHLLNAYSVELDYLLSRSGDHTAQ